MAEQQFYPGVDGNGQMLYTVGAAPQGQMYQAVETAAPMMVSAPMMMTQSYAPRKAIPWREPIMTNMGELFFISEFPNALKQAKHALVPWLQQMNQERATFGLHQIGIREYVFKSRDQAIPFAITDSERFKRNLVILVLPGTCIKHIDNPKSAIDYKNIFAQANNGHNEVLVFVVGPIADPRLTRAGFTPCAPNVDHGDICDPVLLDSGIFQGDVAGTRMLKQGLMFSFFQNLNERQFNRLTHVLRSLSNSCHLSDTRAKVVFHR